MAPNDRVGFLVAGVQKGGTTALFDYLVEHPALSLPSIKEAHHFDDEESVDWSRPDHSAYHALFPADRPHAIRGEATPIYIYWPDSLERIAAYNPAMRLILLFRDPVERAWSHWRMETARGAETQPFSWCIRQGRERVAASPKGAHRVHSYVERGFYGAQLARALTLFPADQLLCLRSSDLKTDPAKILDKVCDFLHADRFAAIRPRLSHVGPAETAGQQISAEDRTYLLGLYASDQKDFRDIVGFHI